MKTWLFTTFVLSLILVMGVFIFAPRLSVQKHFSALSQGTGSWAKIAENSAHSAVALGDNILHRAELGLIKVRKAFGPQIEDVPLRQYAYQGAVKDGANRARLAYPKQSRRHLESTTAAPTGIPATGTQTSN